MRALLTFLMLAFTLSACGYKGPLSLPKPTEASKPITQTASQLNQ